MENKKNTCLACKEDKLEFWTKAWDFEYFSSNQSFTYYRCLTCDSLSIDPVPESLLSLIYPSTYYSYSVKNTRSFVEKIKGILDRRVFKDVLSTLSNIKLSVLDIGGGSGWMLDEVKKVDVRVTNTQVVDINATAQQEASKKGHKFFLGPIENFNPEEKFDLILAFNLIEHVKDPLHFLQQSKKILKKGGKILIKTPNWKSLDAYIFRNSYWGGLHAPRHWVVFTEESLRLLVNQAGLQVSKCKYTQGAPFWTLSVLYILYKLKIVQFDKSVNALSSPLTKIFIPFFAAFDFIRLPFSKTSQMFFILEHKDETI